MGFFRMGLTLTFLNAVVMEPLMIAVMNGMRYCGWDWISQTGGRIAGQDGLQDLFCCKIRKKCASEREVEFRVCSEGVGIGVRA